MASIADLTIEDHLSLILQNREFDNDDPQVIVSLADKVEKEIKTHEETITQSTCADTEACKEILQNASHKKHKDCVLDLFELYLQEHLQEHLQDYLQELVQEPNATEQIVNKKPKGCNKKKEN